MFMVFFALSAALSPRGYEEMSFERLAAGEFPMQAHLSSLRR